MKRLTLTPGFAADVVILDGLVFVAYGADVAEHQAARVQLAVFTPQGVPVRTFEILDGGFSSFPRFGGPWLAYRTAALYGGVAAALNVLNGQAWHYGPAGATYSLAANPAVGVMAFEQQVADGWHVCFGSLENGQSGVTPIPGAPDGIDQIVSDTHVTLRNQTRISVPRLLWPVRAGDLVVGEHADEDGVTRGGVAVQLDGDVARVIGLGGNTPDPRCATDGTTYAIVWWVPGGSVQLWLGSRADVLAIPALPAPAPPEQKPTPTPTPVPVPTPKPETPMSEVMSPAVLSIVGRYVAKFPVPQMPEGATKSDDAFENVCRKWCWGLAEQMHFETGDGRWGVKNAGGGRPQSKDAVAFNGPRLIGYDMMGGVGTGHPTLVVNPSGEDITGQTFMPGSAADHLGVAPPPQTGPTPAPTPVPTPTGGHGAALDGAIAELLRRIAVLENKVAALEARPQASPAPSQPASIDGVRVAIRSITRKVEVDGQAFDAYLSTWDSKTPEFNRKAAGGGETFVIEVQK